MIRREFLGAASAAAIAPVLAPRRVSATALPADITAMTASELSGAIRQRIVSCREVMAAYLDRIDRYNPVYNAIISMRARRALLRDAADADKALDRGEYRGWMHGMPHAVKDLAGAAGLRTTYGSPIFANDIAAVDDLFVARIRNAGAIFIGKTNTPEFGMGSQSYNPVFGATGSAYDPALTAGGSSGGAASGLGLQILPVADGSDMMGSLRNPAAFNNVIGFRPTPGRVPDEGEGDLFLGDLGVAGPMGRNAEDTIRLFCTMAGASDAEPLSLRDELGEPDAFEATGLDEVRIGWLGDFDGHLPTEEGVLGLCQASLKTLESAGVIVEPAAPDYDMARLWRTWLTLRHWTRNSMRPLYDDPARRALLKPEAVWEIEGAFNISGREFHEALVARSDWFRAIRKLLSKYDFLALPTAQVFPFSKDIHWPKQIGATPMDTYHRWMECVIGGTLAGSPVVSVPVGFDGAGRPMGMQIIGGYGEDRRVLEFALAYEKATDFLSVRPKLRVTAH